MDLLIEDFLNHCKKYGNGYCIWRITKKSYKLVVEYIKKKYKNKIVLEMYSSAAKDDILNENYSISGLSESLKSAPNSLPTIIFIKNALKAGMTIDTTYIRQWVDGICLSSKDDGVLQSVARGFGYGKENDKYIIYSNLDIDAMINHYHCIENMLPIKEFPSGVHNKGSKKNIQKSNVVLLVLNSNETKNAKKEALEIMNIIGLKGKSVSCNSTNIESNIWQKDAYLGNLRLRTESNSSNIRIVQFNGYYKNHKTSVKYSKYDGLAKKYYNLCMSEMPELKNRFVLAVTEEEYKKISKTRFKNLTKYVRDRKNDIDDINDLLLPSNRLLQHI